MFCFSAALVLAVLFNEVTSLTTVTVYEHSNYGGGSVRLPDLELYSHYYFTSFNDKTSSYKINTGSCVELYDHEPPGGDMVWSDKDMSSTTLNDRVSSVKMCNVHTKSPTCPSGTFAKSIEWDRAGSLSNGIKLGCFLPSSKTATSFVYTHGSFSGGDKIECPGLRGIEFLHTYPREYYPNLVPICVPNSSAPPHKLVCPKNEAIYGIRADVEDHTNLIKTANIYCKDVGDITKICQAYDEKQTLFTCDATGAVSPLKCTWQKKVGYGKKSSMSESQSTEYTFYSEYGFEMGAAGYGLSANFKATIGNSNTTGYNWESTQESTWTEEVTFTIEIEAPPKCKTTVTEIIGECSFMVVRPYHFERNDTCVGVASSIVTQVMIPPDIAHGDVFTSRIPESLALSSGEFVGVHYQPNIGITDPKIRATLRDSPLIENVVNTDSRK